MVSSKEVLGEFGGRIEPSLPARGMKLMLGVGLLAAVVTLLIVGQWMMTAPGPPNLQGVSDAAGAIKNYSDLSNVVVEAAVKMFDTVVGKVLLPVFTAILGYVFGSKTAA